MTAIGAALAAISVATLIFSRHRLSRVGARLAILAPRAATTVPWWRPTGDLELHRSMLAVTPERVAAAKIVAALAAALVTATLALVIPLGVAPVLVTAYLGYIAPSLFIARRARANRRAADRSLGLLVERVDALVTAGRPPETALALLTARPSGAALLDRVLRRVAAAYALGAPLFRTLASNAREEGLDACAAFADELDRARDLGRGSLSVIRERRNALRAAERARSIEAAAQVEGRLMLVLVLCYMPALVVLVVIPLFVSLLEGLFT